MAFIYYEKDLVSFYIKSSFSNRDEIVHEFIARGDENALLYCIHNYMEKTQPILDFYSSDKGYHEIDGSQKIEVITRKIDEILEV